MNIFVLDTDPVKAAQMQCDKHVVKMILESAQLLCGIFPDGAPYKRTHYNHPCSKWLRESPANYFWLIKHGLALCNEYTYRYNKVHKSSAVIVWCEKAAKDYIHFESIKSKELTPFVKCMPDEYKVEDVVQSYRNYYRGAKKDIAVWTKRNQPDWWK